MERTRCLRQAEPQERTWVCFAVLVAGFEARGVFDTWGRAFLVTAGWHKLPGAEVPSSASRGLAI